MQIITRPARSKELEKIIRILERASNWNVSVSGISWHVLTIPIPREPQKRWIVGCAGISNEDRICYLAVEPNHRRHGYGRKLMEYLEKIIGQNGHVPYLRVKWTNWGAIRLYLSLGYYIAGRYGKKSIVMKKRVRINYRGTLRRLYRWIIPHPKPKNIVLDMDYSGKVSPEIGSRFFNKYNLWCLKDMPPLLEIALSLADKPEWKYWKNHKGTTWTKRFQNYSFKEHGKVISPSILRSLGDSLSNYIDFEYCFQISNKGDWHAGDFADGGSCWFDFRLTVKNAFFKSKKGYAVKFYSLGTIQRNHGIGRCWMYSNDNLLYIFNARGPNIEKMAAAIAQSLNLNYKPIKLSSTFPESYVEDGYVLGKEIPDSLTKYSMEWRNTNGL